MIMHPRHKGTTGEPLVLGSDEMIKILPPVKNTHTLRIGFCLRIQLVQSVM